MNLLRIVFLLFGIVAVLISTVGVLTYVGPLILGYFYFEAVDAIRLSGWVLGGVFGFGILALKNWARWGMLVLVGLKFASVLILMAILRNMQVDEFGLFLILVMSLFFLAVMLLLYKASVFTSGDITAAPKTWGVAGVVTVVLIASFYAIAFVDVDKEIGLEDLPVSASGELNFLEGSTTWSLAKLVARSSSNNNLKTNPHEVGLLSAKRSGDLISLHGIPAFSELLVRIDPARNTLLLDRYVFKGKAIKTDRLLWQDLQAEGVVFSKESGPVSGEVTICRVADGSMYILIRLDIFFREVEAFYLARD